MIVRPVTLPQSVGNLHARDARPESLAKVARNAQKAHPATKRGVLYFANCAPQVIIQRKVVSHFA